MKLTLVQMSMTESMDENLAKSLCACDKAKDSDLIFFPEIQLSPFFPQYEKRDASRYLVEMNSPYVTAFIDKAKEINSCIVPNVYMKIDGKCYDCCFVADVVQVHNNVAKMVHIAQAENFYEQDYYTPSDDGFKVFDTDFGKVGIVICYDRHLPESIRTCVLMGAELVIIPTANLTTEPMEMFEWEVRVQAMQNSVFVAMCNRVGTEGKLTFAGESIVCDPNGNVIAKAGAEETLLTCDIDLSEATRTRNAKPYFATRRKEFYL